ncbi:MFS transporter [Uliginosibacterium flavum]|uniref:MFS transporter n=1 Tax=Uliginosibacterium flavum TaxID=1396831 RepID=A0ABV2TSL5_9RHOO
MTEDDKNSSAWLWLALTAAAMLAITMGARQSLGLFLSPLNTATGLGVASISLAMAVGQFVWGAVQPVAGAVADRYGSGRVLVAGLFVLSAGLALTPFMHSTLGLSLTLGVLMAAGSGAGSFSVLIGAVAQRLPAQHRGMASGIINAGGSFGQFVFAPVVQGLILLAGWMGAMWALAVISLCALPLVSILKKPASIASAATHAAQQGGERLSSVLRGALQDRSYLLLHAGFFTCGFHIAFLVTHLPGEVNLCGLPAGVASWSLAIIGLANIVGSLMAGWAVQRYRSKMVLFWMYASRAVLILLFLAAPKTALTFYVFAAGLGVTWLATVPPTAAVVGKLFGNRYLATLFGLTLFSHQVGGFLGAWLGGLALAHWGSFVPMWWADIVLAALAALVNLPIREAMVVRHAA